MYSYLSGELKKAAAEQLILDVNGIGYRIEIPVSLYPNLPPLGAKLKLHVSFVIREFFQALYGFSSEEERDLFELLIELSGVGPKLALSLLGHLNPQELYHVVLNQDLNTLARVPGIGKKKGERILVDLKGKLPDRTPQPGDYSLPLSSQSLISDATRALVHLGYSHPIALRAVQKTFSQLPENTPLAHVITEALKEI